MCLCHGTQDHIEDDTIRIDGSKQNTKTSVAKVNSELQIYTSPFPSHFFIMIINPSNSTTWLQAYVNMVTVIPTTQPMPDSPNMIFMSQDLPLNNKPSPLYIPACLKGNIVTGVLVDPVRRVNVIIKETLWLNSLHRKEYEEKKSTICMNNGLFLKLYSSITSSVLVGPRVVDTVFDVILESDLFKMKLGIPWLASMNGITSIIHKYLKFSHEGDVYVLHDTRY